MLRERKHLCYVSLNLTNVKTTGSLIWNARSLLKSCEEFLLIPLCTSRNVLAKHFYGLSLLAKSVLERSVDATVKQLKCLVEAVAQTFSLNTDTVDVFCLTCSYARCDELIWVKTNQLQRLIRTGRTGHWLNHGKEHCLVRYCLWLMSVLKDVRAQKLPTHRFF